MQRHTSYMLVILKHEKPIKDLPDVIADRLSKLEGVDGSGVTVSMFDAEAGKDFIVRAEAIEKARYNGDVVEAVEKANLQLINYGVTSFSAAERRALIDMTDRKLYGTPDVIIEPVNKDNLSREDFDKLSRVLTAGMGDNITP